MMNPRKNTFGAAMMAMAFSAMWSQPSGLSVQEPEAFGIKTKNLHLKTKKPKRKKVHNFYVPIHPKTNKEN
jgi:hypothetical protein